MQGWERSAILVPLVLHGWLLYEGIFATSELRFGFAQALSAMLWLAVVIYWIESLFFRLEGMQPLILGTAGICALLPVWFSGRSIAYGTSTDFRIHLSLAIVAYSLFTIAILHAILMAVALPLYLAAVSDSQVKTCRANMQTIANAEAAYKTSTATHVYTTALTDLNTNLGYYTNFVNLLDLCAVAVPAGFQANGLPVGVTLIGPAGQDRLLLGVVVGGHSPHISWGLIRRPVCYAPASSSPT